MEKINDRKCFIELHRILSERFDRKELRTLCFYLGVNYDDLGGEALGEKALELVAYYERREQVSKLIETGKGIRPDITWPDLPEAEEKASQSPSPEWSLNPFIFGAPVPSHLFVDRQKELRRITGRIITYGQSTAIVGEPRSGKTSLLLYLSAPETQEKLYGAGTDRLLFTYIDTQMFSDQFNQAQFWEYALRPLYERVIAPEPDTPLAQAYQTCRENNFGSFVLDRLLSTMKSTDLRLVFLLDEFDVLLHHSILNSAEFFGSLRSLASRSKGMLALVIASRQTLTQLNEATQQFSRTGSPYFNFLSEITLGSLPNKDVSELLKRAGDRFASGDRRFITEVADGHPYLLQVAASMMWEAREEGQDDPIQRWQQVGDSLYEEAELTLSDTWRLWPPTTRRAFTAVALPQIALERRGFYKKRLLRDTRDFGPELRELQKRGFVTEDNTLDTGWRVRPQAFLWWLADEIVRSVRDEPSFEEWLRAQEWDGLLTRGEKEQLGKITREVAELLKGGASELIKAAAQGIIQ
jgi:hypothetical protein